MMHLNCSDSTFMNIDKNNSKQGVHCKTRDKSEKGSCQSAPQQYN